MNSITNESRISTPPGTDGTVERLKLRVDGQEVHCLKTGSGPPVVMLHGGASDSRDWLETMEALEHSYTVYAIDMLGYGLSDRSKPGYYLTDFVDFTLGFIREMGLESFALVGHSLGGRICLDIALKHPELVQRLVLIDTAGFTRLAFWGRSLGAIIWAAREAARIPQPFPKFLMNDGEDRDWLCVDQLPKLSMPTLVVWNSRDPYYPVAGARKASELIPQARLEVFRGYGHAPHVKRREQFNSVLLDFLNHD